MGTALGIILVLAALVAVAYPFVMVQRRRGNAPDPAIMRLRAARTRIYRQIDELDAELQSGEIGAAEHRAQVDELRISAAQVLRELSTLESGALTEDEIEQEIAAARRERASAAGKGDAGNIRPDADR